MRFCQSFFIVLHYLFPAHSGPAASRRGYIRLLSPSLAATQLPHGQLHIPLATPGRSAGYEPLPWGKRARRLLSPSLVATSSRMGNSIFPWLLRAGRAAAGLLHGEDVPSAALHSPGGHSAPQGCSGPATARPAAFMLGPLIHSPYKYTFSSSVMLP